MNKINRTIVGIGLAVIAFTMLMPTITTASADGYRSYGDNTPAKTVSYIVGGVVAYGAISVLLVGAKHKGHHV